MALVSVMMGKYKRKTTYKQFGIYIYGSGVKCIQRLFTSSEIRIGEE